MYRAANIPENTVVSGQRAGPGKENPDTAANNATLSLCNASRVQSMKWCDEGIYLLASQPVDKCQSQDGAEAALQEIEKFLETGAENKIQELNKIYQDYEPILTQDLMVWQFRLFSCSSPVLNGGELFRVQKTRLMNDERLI